MANARHLAFYETKNLTADTVHMVNLRHHAKFHVDQSNCYKDFSRWRPSAILTILKFEI